MDLEKFVDEVIGSKNHEGDRQKKMRLKFGSGSGASSLWLAAVSFREKWFQFSELVLSSAKWG